MADKQLSEPRQKGERFKHTIQDMRNFAASKPGGGWCLSETFNGSHVKHRWRCSAGHEWEAKPSNVLSGKWCLDCSGKRFGSIEEMQSLAQKRGGLFVSVAYRGSRFHHVWRCGKGHEWNAAPGSVKRGRWCPYCSGYAGTTCDTLSALANARGGRFLSEQYSNSSARHRWACAVGHQWETTPASIEAGKWCPRCARAGSSLGERISRAILERMFSTALPCRRPSWLVGPAGSVLELDGFCEAKKIAFEYQGPHHYGDVKCISAERQTHIRQNDAIKVRECASRGIALIVIPAYRRISNLSGCVDQLEAYVLMAGLKIPRKWTRPTSLPEINEPLARMFGQRKVEELRKIAIRNGGRLLSEAVTSASDRLFWRCARGHEWHSRIDNSLLGRWCPHCRLEDRLRSKRQLMAS